MEYQSKEIIGDNRGRPKLLSDPVRIHISIERSDYEALQDCKGGLSGYIRKLVARHVRFLEKKKVQERAVKPKRGGAAPIESDNLRHPRKKIRKKRKKA